MKKRMKPKIDNSFESIQGRVDRAFRSISYLDSYEFIFSFKEPSKKSWYDKVKSKLKSQPYIYITYKMTARNIANGEKVTTGNSLNVRPFQFMEDWANVFRWQADIATGRQFSYKHVDKTGTIIDMMHHPMVHAKIKR